MTPSIAVSGDAIVNRKISVCRGEGFHELLDVLRTADVSFTHLETLIHDYDDVYPAAVPGEMAMRSPDFVPEELKWAGIDLVSHASNHALDYGHGGLQSTWDALDEAGLPHAGTGKSLGDARAPAFVDTPVGRVALVSMTTSFTRWSRAGEARYDHGGRPGVNALRHHHEVDSETLERIRETAAALGQWVTEADDGEWLLNPPGLHNSIRRFVEADVSKPKLVAHDRDRRGNLDAIDSAARQADYVIAHIHTHEWRPDGTLADPPEFVQSFARDCAEAGADVVVGQGSHAPLRGVEIHDGSALFYDPGDLFMMIASATRQPMEFYERFAHNLDTDLRHATPADVFEARTDGFANADNPPGGYFSLEKTGHLVVPVCEFTDEGDLERIVLHPAELAEEPVSDDGVPSKLANEGARDVVSHVAELSEAFGTDVTFDSDEDVGVIRI